MYGLSDSSFAMMTANQTKRKGTTMEHDIFEKFAQLTREEQEKVVEYTLALLRKDNVPILDLRLGDAVDDGVK